MFIVQSTSHHKYEIKPTMQCRTQNALHVPFSFLSKEKELNSAGRECWRLPNSSPLKRQVQRIQERRGEREARAQSHSRDSQKTGFTAHLNLQSGSVLNWVERKERPQNMWFWHEKTKGNKVTCKCHLNSFEPLSLLVSWSNSCFWNVHTYKGCPP